MKASPSSRKSRGHTVLELLIVVTIFAVFSEIILQAFVRTEAIRAQQERVLTRVQPDRAAFYQMIRELRMAGYPATNSYAPAIDPLAPGMIAGGFLTATATDIVFEADIDMDGHVERIEYLVAADGRSVSRRVSRKAADGTVGAVFSVQDPFISDLSNASLPTPVPVFAWDLDPNSTQLFPNNIGTVYVTVAVQAAGQGPQSPGSQLVLYWAGAARRINPGY